MTPALTHPGGNMPRRVSYQSISPAGPVHGGNFEPAKAIARPGRTKRDEDFILYQTPTNWILYTGPNGQYYEQDDIRAKDFLLRNNYNLDDILSHQQANKGKMTVALGLPLKTALYNIAAKANITPGALIKNVLAKHIDRSE